jgi:hypothetical protein
MPLLPVSPLSPLSPFAPCPVGSGQANARCISGVEIEIECCVKSANKRKHLGALELGDGVDRSGKVRGDLGEGCVGSVRVRDVVTVGLGKLHEVGLQAGNECAKGRVLCLLHRVDGGLRSEHGRKVGARGRNRGVSGRNRGVRGRNRGGVRGNLAVRGDAAFVIRAAAAAEGQLRARLGDRARARGVCELEGGLLGASGRHQTHLGNRKYLPGWVYDGWG